MLVERVRAGDEWAWERLIAPHQTAVFRLAYLITADAAAAEDVSQEALWRAYRALDRFDETRPFRPWLLSITRNLARNRQRSLGRRLHALRRWFQQQPPPVTDRDRVSQQHQARQRAERLWQAVQALRPAHQEVIYLRYFLELSEVETAVTLDIPPGTVKSRQHRALGQLRQLIQADYPDLADSWPTDAEVSVDDA